MRPRGTSPPSPLSTSERGHPPSHSGKGSGVRSVAPTVGANSPSHLGKGPGVRSVAPGVRSIFGQKVDPVKVARAKELRHEMTEAECVLWQALRTNHLQGLHFRRQQVIDGFIADFYCHAAGLVVEVDGASHDRQVDYDAERDAVLTARGMRTVRVTNKEVLQDLTGVLGRIAKLIRT